MHISDADLAEICRHTRRTRRAISAAARNVARRLLLEDSKRSTAAAQRYASGALDGYLRTYLADPTLADWIGEMSKAVQPAARALLTRRFFRVAKTDCGHHVLDYMVAVGLAQFNRRVAATVDLEPEAVGEDLWEQVAAWLLSSLSRGHSAFISLEHSAPPDSGDDPRADRLQYLVERLCGEADPVVDSLLDTFRGLLRSAFDESSRARESEPSIGTSLPKQMAVLTATQSAEGASRPQGKPFWWDPAKMDFEGLVHSEALKQPASRAEFWSGGFVYSPVGRLLRLFAVEAVDVLVYTVDCSQRFCSHARHTLRQPGELNCGCLWCERSERMPRARRWLVTVETGRGEFRNLIVCMNHKCRRVSGTEAQCRECASATANVSVWVPASLLHLDVTFEGDEGQEYGPLDRVSSCEPSIERQIIDREKLDDALHELRARVEVHRNRAREVRTVASHLFEALLRDSAARIDTEGVLKRLLVVLTLMPTDVFEEGVSKSSKISWIFYFLRNLINPSPDRAQAISSIPSRLANCGAGVPTWWTREQLKPSYFGKIKAGLVSEWLKTASMLRDHMTALEDATTLEDIENLDELEAIMATL